MKFSKKIISVFFAFTISFGIAPLLKGSYSQKNKKFSKELKKLLKMGRTPLAMLIDKDETPSDSTVDAITSELITLIKGGMPIVASASLFYNFVYRRKYWKELDQKFGNNQNEKSFLVKGFYKSKWKLLDIPKTQCILLLPKKYERKIERYLKVSTFKDISSLINDSSKLIRYLEERFSPEITDISQFRRMFWDLETLQKEGTVGSLVLYLSGHGFFGYSVSGLPLPVFSDFLEFFKGYLCAMFISSCYAGGQHTEFMRYYDYVKKIARSLPYYLIVQGMNDASVGIGIFYSNQFLKQMVRGKNRTIEEILRHIATLYFSPFYLHAQKNIPQCIAPYGAEFFPLNLSKHFASITKVMRLKYEMENNTVVEFTPNPLVTHVHVDDVPHLVKVKPLNLTQLYDDDKFELFGKFYRKRRTTQWKNFPVAAEKFLELLKRDKGNRVKKIWNNHFPRKNNDSHALQMHDNSDFTFPLVSCTKKRGRPEVGVRTELSISRIKVVSDALNYTDKKNCFSPEMGVLHFLRDQLDVSAADDDEKGMRIVKYKEIKGSNDISILCALIRHEKKLRRKTDLEKALEKKKTITLFDVQTEVGFDRHEEKIVRRVRFSFEDKNGKLRTWASCGDGWNFVEEKRSIEKSLKRKITKTRALMKGKTGWEQDDASTLWRTIFDKKIDLMQAITNDHDVTFWVNRVKDGKDFDLVQKIAQRVWKKNNVKTTLKLLIELVKEGQMIDFALNVAQEAINGEVLEDAWTLWDVLISKEKGVFEAIELAKKWGISTVSQKQKKALSLWAVVLSKGRGVSVAIKMIENFVKAKNIKGFPLLLCRELIRSKKQHGRVKELISKIKNYWFKKTNETALKVLEIIMEFQDEALQEKVVDRIATLIDEIEKKTPLYQAKFLYAWKKLVSIGILSLNRKIRKKSLNLFKQLCSFFVNLVKKKQFKIINVAAKISHDEVRKAFVSNEAKSWGSIAFLAIAVEIMDSKDMKERAFKILLERMKDDSYLKMVEGFLDDMSVDTYKKSLSLAMKFASGFLQKKMLIFLLKYVGYDDQMGYEKTLKTIQIGMPLNDEEVQLRALKIFGILLDKGWELPNGKKLIDTVRKSNFVTVKERAEDILIRLNAAQ